VLDVASHLQRVETVSTDTQYVVAVQQPQTPHGWLETNREHLIVSFHGRPQSRKSNERRVFESIPAFEKKHG
jgi:hypothetical protein